MGFYDEYTKKYIRLWPNNLIIKIFENTIFEASKIVFVRRHDGDHKEGVATLRARGKKNRQTCRGLPAKKVVFS
jgi:hypothetical protein